MDIEKLEKLSCLKIPDDKKQELAKSLDGVFNMMHAIDTMKSNIQSKDELLKTEFVIAESEKFNRQSNELPVENGYFLAPKVIKK